MTSEAGIYGTMSSQYDAADRRTRLTWGDGFHVGYEYNLAGEMTAIRENGAMVLASYGYDNLGRRVSRLLGNPKEFSIGRVQDVVSIRFCDGSINLAQPIFIEPPSERLIQLQLDLACST